MSRKHGAKKLPNGEYSYKDYTLVNYGYHAPDHCVWWQAINDKTGCADFSRSTKWELMEEIDEWERKEMNGL